MKNLLKYLCVGLLFLLTFTAYAKLTSEAIFLNLDNEMELWRTRVDNTDSARPFFRNEFPGPPTLIDKLSIQRNGTLVAIISDTDKPFFDLEAYLIDTNAVPLKARALTQNRFHDVWDIDISQDGDIVFTNLPIDIGDPPPKLGIYFIPKRELNNVSPKITLLKETDALNVEWAPDGKSIAYDGHGGLGVFTMDIATRRISKVSDFGKFPAFSPDGKKLVFAYLGLFERQAREIRVISLNPMRHLLTLKDLRNHRHFIDLKWSPDGKYIVYTASDDWNYNIAIPLNGGPHEEILDIEDGNSTYLFDWAPSAYPVEPMNRLTTLWGALKIGILK